MSRKLAVLFLTAAVVLFLAHAFHLRCVAEDSYISFRFAANLSAGHGFVWNIGDAPVEGFTNYLWVVLCAAALRAGLDVIRFSQALGVLAGTALVVCAYRYARKVAGCCRPAAVAACFLIACSGPVAAWAASGMETVPFALLVLLSAYEGLRFLGNGRSRHATVGSLAMVGAALLRPEGLMTSLLTLAAMALLWDGSKGRRTRIALPLLVFAIPFGAYFLWRYRYFGYLLPNTFYAKTGGGAQQVWRGGVYALDYSCFYVLPLILLVLLWLWEACRAWDTTQACTPLGGLSKVGCPRRNAGLVVCLALLGPYVAYIVSVGGDYMAMYRFFVPLAPLVALCAGWVAHRLLAATGRCWPQRGLVHAAWIFCGLASLALSTPAEAVVFRKPRYHHGRYQGVFRERWHTARLAAIGKFFGGYRRNYDETLATDAIGAVGYYSNMKVLDVHGLTDTHIAHLEEGRAKLGTGFPGHEKSDLAYIFALRPTYYMFSRALSNQPLAYPSFGGDLDPRVSAEYELRSEWLTDAVNGEAGYFTFLARRANVGVLSR